MKTELHSTIGRLIQDAQQDEASEIRSALFDRYMGEPYGDEVAGRSEFVSTDVADAVEAILPDIMDVFMSSEGIAEFQPVGPEDEAAAKQETEVVEHIFWQKNRGLETLLTWLKEGLIQQNAYVRYGWDKRERVEIEEFEDLTPEEFVAIVAEKQAKGVEYEVEDIDGGEMQEDGTFSPMNVRLRCVSIEKRYVIECIPQEEFFHTPRWNRVGLDGIPCCGHRRKVERGELLRMGFDPDSVEAATDNEADTYQKDTRFDTRDNFEDDANVGDKATKLVTVYEAYVRCDFNDDGKAELVRVWATGDGSTILKWEDGRDAIDEVSHIPFAAWTPYLVPHRHIGRSVAELVDDIQQVKTVLLRHTLDNLYLTNYPRPAFDESQAGPNTYTDLANPAPGAPIRTGGAMIEWQMPPSVIGTTLPLIEQFDALKETRTGATRYNQGLDADSLNKTMGGMKMILNASQKKTLLIARTFAEIGLRDLFLGIHRDLRSGPVKEMAVKLSGGWVAVNPRTWADRSDMTVLIGGISREEKRNALMMIATFQEKMAMSGSRLVGEPQLYETASELAASFGYPNASRFFANPQTLPPPAPPPPDPQMMLAQAQLQMMQQDNQQRFLLEVEKFRLEAQKVMADLDAKAREIARKESETASGIMTDAERLDLERRKAVLEDDFKRDKLLADAAVRSAPAVDYGAV